MSDINIQLDDKKNIHTNKFVQLFESQVLLQHVVGPTDTGGHIFDVLSTRAEVKPSALLVEEPSLSDHAFITADLDVLIDNGRPIVSVVERRRWRGFDVNIFSTTSQPQS